MNHRERDKPGGEEQLIGQRIQHGSEPGMLICHAGDCPIERVSESGSDKDDESLIESAVHKQPNVAGNQENTEDGQAVGDIHIFRNTSACHSGGK